MIGQGVGFLGAGLSYFFLRKKRLAALLWPVALGVVTVLWLQVGKPLLEAYLADKVKIERVAPLNADSLTSLWGIGGDFSAYAGTVYIPEVDRASQGNVERYSGAPITIKGQLYGYADTTWEAWKLAGSPVILLHKKKTGEVFKVEAPMLDERIMEQRKK